MMIVEMLKCWNSVLMIELAFMCTNYLMFGWQKCHLQKYIVNVFWFCAQNTPCNSCSVIIMYSLSLIKKLQAFFFTSSLIWQGSAPLRSACCCWFFCVSSCVGCVELWACRGTSRWPIVKTAEQLIRRCSIFPAFLSKLRASAAPPNTPFTQFQQRRQVM